MKRFLLAATTAVILAAPAVAQTKTPAAYVAAAGAGDLYETQSSKLVLQSSKNAGIRRFAQQMITDHAKSTADVKAAAAKSGVRAAPPKLDAMQAGNMAKLRAASGTARDTEYVAQQRAAHDQALALHQDYAANGSAPALKAAAAKITPVVQHHVDELAAM